MDKPMAEPSNEIIKMIFRPSESLNEVDIRPPKICTTAMTMDDTCGSNVVFDSWNTKLA